MDWLMKILGMQGGGGGPLWQGGSSGPAANNGMPISGVGPGAAPSSPMNLMPSGGLWNPGRTMPGAPGAGPQPNVGQNFALGQAANLLKPAQFQPVNWMQLGR